jgi:hypothetical protein
MHYTGSTSRFQVGPKRQNGQPDLRGVRQVEGPMDHMESSGKFLFVILYKNSPPDYYFLRNYPLLAKDDQVL